MRPVRRHDFAGQRYRIRNHGPLPPGDLGQTDYDRRIVTIPADGDTLHELDTISHEAVHAACPWLAEWIVAAAAESIARLLWRLGWRRVHD